MIDVINVATKMKFDAYFLARVPVRVLIVTDDEGSFSPEHRFGLTELISALKSFDSLTTEFKVTTAHRLTKTADGLTQVAEHADIEGFRFTAPYFKPSDYDEIWLFGIASSKRELNSYPLYDLSAEELRNITSFMNAGGGVFATGDHENLGQPLCGHLPRVRSMRKWHFDYDRLKAADGTYDYGKYDPATGDAPPVVGKYRHDTVVPGADGKYAFDDQSDDTPAILYPVSRRYETYVARGSYPHPLLCTPRGAIEVLPDHMHEGEIVVPSSLEATYSFAGLTGEEYPKDAFGYRVKPEVVAFVETIEGHKTRLEKKDLAGGKPGQAEEETSVIDREVVKLRFGAIGAYDGHLAKVGRVAVDSTFHHFVNVNLNGAGSNSFDPAKRLGLTGSASGKQHYEKIKDYYRNIGLWLAPKAIQEKIFERAVWIARHDSQVTMLGAPAANSTDIVLFGRAVKDAMLRLHPPCFVVGWTLGIVDPGSILFGKIWLDLNRPNPPWDGHRLLVRPDDFIAASLGGMVAEVMRLSERRDIEVRDAIARDMPVILRRGAADGLRRIAEITVHNLEHTARFIHSLTQAQSTGSAELDQTVQARAGE